MDGGRGIDEYLKEKIHCMMDVLIQQRNTLRCYMNELQAEKYKMDGYQYVMRCSRVHTALTALDDLYDYYANIVKDIGEDFKKYKQEMDD